MKKWIAVSLTFHLFALLLATYLTKHSETKRDFYAPVLKATLVTIEEPRKARPAPVKRKKAASLAVKVKKKSTPKSAPKTKKTKKAPAPAHDAAAAIAAIRREQEAAMAVERIKGSLKEEKAPETVKREADSTAAKAGVKKVSVENMDRLMQAYYDLLWEKIEAAWVLPGTGSFEGLVSIITVVIGRSGELIKVYVEEGSGNGFYDQSALRAVKKSAPFPPIPEGYEGGLEIGFRFKP